MNDGYVSTTRDLFALARRYGDIRAIYHNKIVTNKGATIHYYRWHQTQMYVAPRNREIYYCVEK